MGLLLLLSFAALPGIAGGSTPCTLPPSVDIAVYAVEGWGGAGSTSVSWTRSFFSWLSGANPGLSVGYVTNASEISSYPASGCPLASLKRLKLWVQPGGSANNFTLSLGPGGRDNIQDFAASAQGHLLATCAGFYYMAGSYWWQDSFFPVADSPHYFPTVEGPIAAIAAYPAYAPVQLSDGRTVLYWGGPTLGLQHTAPSVPNGGAQLAAFATPALPRPLGAAYSYTGQGVRALLSTAHPEAVAGVGIACAPPLPAGCLTPAQQLRNWQWLAEQINALLGQQYAVPGQL